MVGINNSIGRTLKRIRERKKLSLAQTSKELQKRFRIYYSPASLSRMESGRGQARANIVAALSVIYNVTLESILLTNYEYGYSPEPEEWGNS